MARPPVAVLDVESGHLQHLVRVEELPPGLGQPRPGVLHMEDRLPGAPPPGISSPSVFPEHSQHSESTLPARALQHTGPQSSAGRRERNESTEREREGGGRTNLLGVELGSGAGGGDGEERESGGGCHGDSGEGGGGDGGGESRRRGEKEDHKKLENDPFFEGSLGRLDDKEWESRAISSGRPQPDTWTTTRATPALVDGRLSTRTLLAARVPKSTPPRVLTTMPARPLEIWLLIRADLRVAPVI